MTNLSWTMGKAKLSDLEEYEKNPVELTERDARELAKSIKKYPQVLPYIAAAPKNGHRIPLLDGHQRKKVSVSILGMPLSTVVDVRFPSRKLTDKERQELIIRLRKNTGRFDNDGLLNWFDSGDLLDWGFEQKELETIGFEFEDTSKDAEPEIDRAGELLKKWKVKTGDMFTIGNHRLICGDCTDAATVARVLEGVDKYSVLTDPPYNIGFNYESIDDEMTKENYADFCRKYFENIVPNSYGAIITPGPKNERLYPEPRDKGIWVKPNATAGASCFHLRLAEPILFYGKFANKRNTDVFEYSSGFASELTAAQRAAGVADKHPPAKSMPLWEELVKMTEGEVVDTFLGNGTSLIACENLSRRCRAIEISPAYVAVALERMSAAFPDLKIEKVKNGSKAAR